MRYWYIGKGADLKVVVVVVVVFITVFVARVNSAYSELRVVALLPL
jgi:hypothetical protein